MSIFGNAFYRNDGTTASSRRSPTLWVNTENFWPWGFSVGDLNADGYEDIFRGLEYELGRFAIGVNTLLLNNRGDRKFLDA